MLYITRGRFDGSISGDDVERAAYDETRKALMCFTRGAAGKDAGSPLGRSHHGLRARPYKLSYYRPLCLACCTWGGSVGRRPHPCRHWRPSWPELDPSPSLSPCTCTIGLWGSPCPLSLCATHHGGQGAPWRGAWPHSSSEAQPVGAVCCSGIKGQSLTPPPRSSGAQYRRIRSVGYCSNKSVDSPITTSAKSPVASQVSRFLDTVLLAFNDPCMLVGTHSTAY